MTDQFVWIGRSYGRLLITGSCSGRFFSALRKVVCNCNLWKCVVMPENRHGQCAHQDQVIGKVQNVISRKSSKETMLLLK